jgi:hypothetical protein
LTNLGEYTPAKAKAAGDDFLDGKPKIVIEDLVYTTMCRILKEIDDISPLTLI